MRLIATAAGEGAPVCLLHGLFGRARNLGAVARGLALSHRVISLDLRNHGDSARAPGMSYADMSDDVLQTLAALGALPCTLLGHSMGGKVAMATALRAPADVSALVVADIAPVAYRHGNARFAEAMLALRLPPGLARADADAALAAAVPDAGVRAFLMQNLSFGEAPRWKIGLEWIARAMADIEGWPAELENQRYDGPALFIRGGASDYVADADWPAVRTFFPRARLVTIEGAGHWLHADKPAEFLAAVQTGLSGDRPFR